MLFHQTTNQPRFFRQVTLRFYFDFSARQQEMYLLKENIASIANKDGRVFTLNGYVLQRKTFHICHPYQFIGLPH